MKTYNTITDYLTEAKPNDIIVLGGTGIMDGMKAESKHDTYKVHTNTTGVKLVVRRYRERTNLTTNEHNQKVGVLSKKEFQQLPTLW